MELLAILQNARWLLELAKPQPGLWSGPAADALINQIEFELRALGNLEQQLWLN